MPNLNEPPGGQHWCASIPASSRCFPLEHTYRIKSLKTKFSFWSPCPQNIAKDPDVVPARIQSHPTDLWLDSLSLHSPYTTPALWQRKPLLSQSGDGPELRVDSWSSLDRKHKTKFQVILRIFTEIPHDSASFHCYDRSQLNSNGGKCSLWITAKRKAQKGWDVLFRPCWCLAAKLETNFKPHKPCHFGTCGKVHLRCEAKT